MALHAMRVSEKRRARRWQGKRGCNGKCIDPKVHNLRHTEIRVFPSTESPVKTEERSRAETARTEYTSPDTLSGPQGGLNGIIPIWKGPHHVVNHTGHHLRPFQRPATSFSMNLSAFVKCVDDGGGHAWCNTDAFSSSHTRGRFISVVLERILEVYGTWVQST